MNDSRKQASGFKLQSLARMAGVKDEQNISFLHHVEKVTRTAFPSLETFLEDLKPCREAAIGTPAPTQPVSNVISLHSRFGTRMFRIHRIRQNRPTILRPRRPLRSKPLPPRRPFPKTHPLLPPRSPKENQKPLRPIRSHHLH